MARVISTVVDEDGRLGDVLRRLRNTASPNRGQCSKTNLPRSLDWARGASAASHKSKFLEDA